MAKKIAEKKEVEEVAKDIEATEEAEEVVPTLIPAIESIKDNMFKAPEKHHNKGAIDSMVLEAIKNIDALIDNVKFIEKALAEKKK